MLESMGEHMRAAAVHRAQGEILQACRATFYSGDVRKFADLHDYMDANTLGGLTDEIFIETVRDMGEDVTTFRNDVIRIVDLWLRSGAHREPCMLCGYPMHDDDGEGTPEHTNCLRTTLTDED